MPVQPINVDEILKERLARLPAVVRNAITSADLEKKLRDLANTHKLHLDQWQVLENEVMMTLLGVRRVEELQENLKKQLKIVDELARTLAENINIIVFEPIRQELERQLEHPDAKEKEVSGVEQARNEALAGTEKVSTPPAPAAPPPPTPPPSAPDVKVTRPSESSAYKPGETSAARAAVHDDPYREPPA